MRFIAIEVQGEEKLKVALTKMADAIEDLTPYWNDVQQEFYKIEKQAFASEGKTGASGHWKQLSMPYADIKARNYGDLPILELTGALKASLTSETATGAITKKEKDSLTLGSSISYAHWHQTGTPKGQMPARPPISLTENQHAQLLRKLTKQLKGVANRNGF